MIKTDKLYYKDSFLSSCTATVMNIVDNKVILDRTVAFPEGGGQIGDVGMLIVNNQEIPFYDTQKGVGRILNISESHRIVVDTPVYHFIDSENTNNIKIGDPVIVEIDVNHRIWTTTLHTALHLVLMVARERRPKLTEFIKGCKISTDRSRIDFFTYEKFMAEDIKWISNRVNELISMKIPIYNYPCEDENEVRFWKCLNFICLCGGTHLINTSQLGILTVRRKNIGKSTERLIVSADNIGLSVDDYYQE